MNVTTEVEAMRSIPLHEAEGHLQELAELIDKGEEIELLRPGKPSMRLVVDAPNQTSRKRRFGQYAGEAFYMSEDFNEPLPESYWLGEDKT
ncbi:type II toxin-antitoxin system Phd/YefM family antitoxin [Agaribacter flavus]|uniref:Type II toxin-antitoxin system Phd/YefM family antitoxin n=1 Tax=Agaribacter flavus TaxID=1902781 RepID=A0ABV7FMF6_9ALTE